MVNIIFVACKCENVGRLFISVFLPSMREVVVCDELAMWDVSDSCHEPTPCLDNEARDKTRGNDWSRRDHL